MPQTLALCLLAQWHTFGSERGFSRWAAGHLHGTSCTLPACSQFNRALRRVQSDLATLLVYTAQTAQSQAAYESSTATVWQRGAWDGVATQGKSRLLPGVGMSANPQIGRIPYREGQGNAPFITLYPISEPHLAHLAEAGAYELPGAVRLSVGARTSKTNHCEAGSYLPALKTIQDGALALCLLTAQAEADGQLHYHESLQIPAERITGDDDRGDREK